MEPPVKKKKKHHVEQVAESRISKEIKDKEEYVSQLKQESANAQRVIDVAGIQRDIAKLLKFSTFEPEHQYWLNTGSRELNGVLGTRMLGLPYGKQWEANGLESGGKTTIATILAGMAQRDGAAVGYIDLEQSRDKSWAAKLGLDLDNVVKLYPKLIYEKKKKKKWGEPKEEEVLVDSKGKKAPRLQSAEEIFAEAEIAMQRLWDAGFEKQFWIVDSIANIVPLKVIAAGTTGQTMNTNFARAAFLASVLPKWAGLAANYNAIIFFVNQLRSKQGRVFGDPFDSPGGRALKHALAVRVRVRRAAGGQLKQIGKGIIGIAGVIRNQKNKAGENSVEARQCGFMVRWDRPVAKIDFMSVKDVEDSLKGEEE